MKTRRYLSDLRTPAQRRRDAIAAHNREVEKLNAMLGARLPLRNKSGRAAG